MRFKVNYRKKKQPGSMSGRKGIAEMTLFCYISIILGIFFGELRIKNFIEKSGPDSPGTPETPEAGQTRNHVAVPSSIWKNRILIRRYHNKGAMLNLGQHRSSAVAVLSVALCLLMTAAFVLSLGQRGNALLRTGLSFLLGGAFSNTYDRLKRKYVVDYFSFHVKWAPLSRIVFNLSDFCIMAGALVAVLGTPD